jgi:glycosyltransferase involved in cell wall biosynthesis
MGPDGEDPRYAARCRDRVRDAGLEDRITFHGSVNLRERFGSCDALLLPSHNEGQPIVVLEAMTIGLPTIGTRVGGMQELIEDVLIDENGTELHPGGILMEAHDIRAMADAIVRLMATPGLAGELGANAQARVLSHFHIDGAMSHYGALFGGGLGAPDLVHVAEPAHEAGPDTEAIFVLG